MSTGGGAAGAGTGGYWATLGFETSSVDFCEGNFESSYYIAEPLNTLSSVPLVVLGVFGVLRGNAARRAPKGGWEHAAFAWSYALLAAVGSGSLALHATLIAPGQAADEVPMLLLNLVLLFIICELESGTAALRRPWLPLAFSAVGVGAVAVYLRYRAFYSSFLTLYAISVLCVVGGSARLALQPRTNSLGERARINLLRPLFISAITSYAVGGLIAWLLEFNYCA